MYVCINKSIMLATYPIIWLIDDRDLDCFISKKVITNVLGNIVVEVMIDSEKAIDRLHQLSQSQKHLLPDYIFLDVDMPNMNGWQVLEECERLKVFNGREVHVYMLSSSVYIADIKHSQSYQLVEDFISKPITTEKVKEIFHAA
jgi:CheY-like chemotaxis protein